MQSKYNPFDLKISVSPHGGIDEWQWTLSIGNDAPIEIGVVKGSRMDGIRAAREISGSFFKLSSRPVAEAAAIVA